MSKKLSLLAGFAVSFSIIAHAGDIGYLSPEKAAEKISAQFNGGNFAYYGFTMAALVAAGDKNITQGNETLNAKDQTQFLASTPNIPVNHPFVKELSAKLLKGSKSDLEKILILHNFVLWRMTYPATFSPKNAIPEALATRKGRLAVCINENIDKGIADAWTKPPPACGLHEDIDVGDHSTLALFFTGLHNCYGFAHVFATLARASGFPTQVVNQDRDGLHIWNRIFFRGAWRVVDTAFDDRYDLGTYEDHSAMQLDINYFLISDAEAAQKDPESHHSFAIDPD